MLYLYSHLYRITNRLDGLTTSLIAWKQFESGLSEFKEALGKDKGALKGLTGALEELTHVADGNEVQMTGGIQNVGSVESKLALDVKEVAKRLSEQMDNQRTSKTPLQQVSEILMLHMSSSSPSRAMHKLNSRIKNVFDTPSNAYCAPGW